LAANYEGEGSVVPVNYAADEQVVSFPNWHRRLQQRQSQQER
jgi:hypothetical protein